MSTIWITIQYQFDQNKAPWQILLTISAKHVYGHQQRDSNTSMCVKTLILIIVMEKALKPLKSTRSRDNFATMLSFLQVYHWCCLGHSHYGCFGENKWSKGWRNKGVCYCQSCIMGFESCIINMERRVIEKLTIYLTSWYLGLHHEPTSSKM